MADEPATNGEKTAVRKPWYITERASWWNTTCLLVWTAFRRRPSQNGRQEP